MPFSSSSFFKISVHWFWAACESRDTVCRKCRSWFATHFFSTRLEYLGAIWLAGLFRTLTVKGFDGGVKWWFMPNAYLRKLLNRPRLPHQNLTIFQSASKILKTCQITKNIRSIPCINLVSLNCGVVVNLAPVILALSNPCQLGRKDIGDCLLTRELQCLRVLRALGWVA